MSSNDAEPDTATDTRPAFLFTFAKGSILNPLSRKSADQGYSFLSVYAIEVRKNTSGTQ